LAYNLAGSAAYVFAASRGGWRIPAEQAAGIDTLTGEPFIWFLNVAPIILLFLVMNLAVAAYMRRRPSGVSGWIWMLVVMTWSIAVFIDFAHH
jgi:hypothetical protein